ncbi:hypothetical protein LSCM1_00488 [Leishmania martiniquensis]|uniref:Uncharacterized protein n=1 Tax=Leishmania martiniquensis TaxID=1580590 RepID=A0A836GSR3_9TRYP|nr:hypothetical protein LSCM1_00488 [Leishmania martiniquensis]
MPVASTRASKFSAALNFTSNDIIGPGACTAEENKRGTADGQPQAKDRAAGKEACDLALAEESLQCKAASLRRSIEADLMPRQEKVERALLLGRRQLAELQHLLPSVAFLRFRQKCALLCDRLHFCEELVVQALLTDAVGRAVRSGEVTEPLRWRKSNQWPVLTNVLQLQLQLYLADGNDAAVAAVTPSRLSHETNAVHRHLAACWAEHQERLFTDDFLGSYYTLKDVVHGWGSGWYARVSCADREESVGLEESSRAPHDVPGARTCPFPVWASLSDLNRLLSYSTLCPRHLTEDVVRSLETPLLTHFSDVWYYVEHVISSRSR